MVNVVVGLFGAVFTFLFVSARDIPTRLPMPYWQIILITVAVSLGWALFRYGFALSEALEPFGGIAVGCSLGFCAAEAARRRRDKRKAPK